jgi:hypothetical protein
MDLVIAFVLGVVAHWAFKKFGHKVMGGGSGAGNGGSDLK